MVKDYYKRLINEDLYIQSITTPIAVKRVKGKESIFFAKTKEGHEFRIASTAGAVDNIIESGKEITKEEYENYGVNALLSKLNIQ